MDYVETSVSEILVVCNDPDIMHNVRGHLFELLIIRRCQGRSLYMNNLNGKNDADIEHFPGFTSCKVAKRFPRWTLPTLADDGLYVPVNPNFPAVDLIWKMQGNIWFVQVHVSRHDDVSQNLQEMIQRALGLHKIMVPANLFLLYLSPTREISASLAAAHRLPRDNAVARPLFRIMAKSMDMFSCFEDLRWQNI